MAGSRALLRIWYGLADALPKVRILMAAAILAGAATLATGQPLKPRGPVNTAASPAASFSERFVVEAPKPDCSTRSWPYLTAECLRMPDGSRPRPVRIIAVDGR